MLISTSDVDHVTEVIDIVQQRSKGIPALIRAPAGARWSRVTLEVVPGSALERAVRHQLGLDEPAVFAPWESLVARLRKPDGSPLVTFTFSGAVPLSVTPGTSGAVLAFVVERIEQQSPGQ